jgi:hypothetical protein
MKTVPQTHVQRMEQDIDCNIKKPIFISPRFRETVLWIKTVQLDHESLSIDRSGHTKMGPKKITDYVAFRPMRSSTRATVPASIAVPMR